MSEVQNVAPDAETRRSPAQFLRAIYLERKTKNPQYSLNAFARDLELSSSQVSRLLSGSRAFTLRQVFHITSILNLNESETQSLIVEVIKKSNQNAKIPKHVREQFMKESKPAEGPATADPGFYSSTNLMYLQYEVERFKSISQWYHLAILNLTYTKSFKSDPQHIAERLGITHVEAMEAIDRLLHLGLLKKDAEGNLKKTSDSLYIKTMRSESALRKFHGDMLDKAKNELQKTEDADFKNRLINSVTFACAPEHIEALKDLTNRFHEQVLALTKNGPHEEIYQLNCQLFALTQKTGANT